MSRPQRPITLRRYLEQMRALDADPYAGMQREIQLAAAGVTDTQLDALVHVLAQRPVTAADIRSLARSRGRAIALALRRDGFTFARIGETLRQRAVDDADAARRRARSEALMDEVARRFGGRYTPANRSPKETR